MSLATRCSACGTVFRVVQDQLKVSEGWVRCGRCNEVFNALEGLFDLERETPPDWDPQEHEQWARPAPPAPAEASVHPDGAHSPEPVDDPELVRRIDSELFGERALPRMAAAPAEPRPARSDAAWSTSYDDAGIGPPDAYQAPVFDRDDESADNVAPDFLRKAEREERWKRPWVKLSLGSVSIALLGLLGLQMTHHFRNGVAARWPDLAPFVANWCAMADCSLGPVQHIDDVAVESTALSRAGSADAYRLSLVLRNHGSLPVALPAIDLALTDTAGQLIARRTLTALDFTAAPSRIPPGGEVPLQLVLSAGAARITGYTVEVFYP